MIIFHQWSLKIVFNFTCFFRISNRKRKYIICYYSLTWNIVLKQTLVKLGLSCNGIFFNPLYIKIKPMILSFRLSLKQVFFIFFTVSFFWTILLRQILTTWPYKLFYNAILDISWNVFWIIWMLKTNWQMLWEIV